VVVKSITSLAVVLAPTWKIWLPAACARIALPLKVVPCVMRWISLASSLNSLFSELRQLVGLRHHGVAGLLQDLRARHAGRFRRVVGVHDAAAGGALVFRRHHERRDHVFKPVLHGAEGAALAVDGVDGGVQRGQHGHGRAAVGATDGERRAAGAGEDGGAQHVGHAGGLGPGEAGHGDLVDVAHVVGTDLEGGRVGGRQDVLVVELRATQGARGFLGQLRELFVQAQAVAVAVGAVGGLHRQFTHALEDVGGLAERAFCHLRQRDAVIGIAHGHVHAPHLGVHAFGNRQAGGVVLGTVDAQT
jgi:hypothetical protein